MNNLLIIGAGGLGIVIGQLAKELCRYNKISFLDDAVDNVDVVGKCVDYIALKGEYTHAVAAFGDNALRLAWTDKLIRAKYNVPALIHPTAYVSPTAIIGDGSFVLHKAIISTDSKIGKACLVNSGAIVDHNNELANGVHINLNSTVKAWCHLKECQRTEVAEVVYSTRRKIAGVDDNNLEDAIFAFKLGECASYVKPFGSGHINDTYAVYVGEDNKEELRYVIQRINKSVFKNPNEVMENIFGVTEFLRKKIKSSGGDPDRETLNYIKTKTGANYFEDVCGSPWRCYNYIPHSKCIDSLASFDDFYNSGKAFGNFLCLLGDYPADTLHETIPDFHNTKLRFDAFSRAVTRDIKSRAAICMQEIAFAKDREKDAAVLVDMLENGQLPLRVTHNDTKLNNILFDDKTGEALCVIDLDTIMPGLALNDFGDSIRFGASTAAEDEQDLDKVHFSLELFEAYAKGYLQAAGQILTKEEIDYLPWGARLMTLECGMRFLTDYLEGDTYFKASRDGQNLDRCRTQFRLVAEMEQHFDEMKNIVNKYR